MKIKVIENFKARFHHLKSQSKKLYWPFVFFVLVSQEATAKSWGEDGLEAVKDLLISTWGAYAATIAIVIVGYLWLYKQRIEWQRAVQVIAAIGLIFGAVPLVEEVRAWFE